MQVGNAVQISTSKINKKALQKGRKAGIREVKRIYTIKKGSEGVSSVKVSGDTAYFTIKGKRLNPERYKTKSTNKGLFLSVVKGQGGIIERSFLNEKWNKHWFMRISKERLPINRINTNSIPQLYGNKSVQKEIAKEVERSIEI